MSWKIFGLLLLGVLMQPLQANADPVIYDFTLTHVFNADLTDPSTFLFQTVTFSLEDGQAPSGVAWDESTPGTKYFLSSAYSTVAYTLAWAQNGQVLSQESHIGTVDFVWDGISVDGFHVFNAPLPFDRNGAEHPVFVEGHYISLTQFQWYDVTAETPEPSTLALLGTGLVSAVAMRRRLLAS